MSKKIYEEIVTHVKNSGFVFQGSEIYGGLSNTWDFGPLGIELKNNVKDRWWKKFIRNNPLNVGIQSAILMNPKVWEASGHLKTFADPLMDCRHCKTRHRADKLIEEFSGHTVNAAKMSITEMEEYIKEYNIPCPDCGHHDFTPIRQFNLMFKTFQGVVEDNKSTIYLRPETAQGMFVNFKNVQRTSRKKIPFGIGQIGKSFRNEITPGNFIFRTREFEQMELEFFCKPGDDLEWYAYWQNFCLQFLIDLGINKENLRIREHDKEELSHYSVATSDIEYKFPWGWDELWGIADRTDYDLKQHQLHSKVSMEYLDPATNEKYIPYCVEPALGVERLMFVLMCEAYDVESLENDERVVMHFSPVVSPIKICVLPLSKQLNPQALEVYQTLSEHFACEFDDAGSIGKRYRRQDAIGTPYCLTVDFDSLDDHAFTLRSRDSMQQVRLSIDDIIQQVETSVKG